MRPSSWVVTVSASRQPPVTKPEHQPMLTRATFLRHWESRTPDAVRVQDPEGVSPRANVDGCRVRACTREPRSGITPSRIFSKVCAMLLRLRLVDLAGPQETRPPRPPQPSRLLHPATSRRVTDPPGHRRHEQDAALVVPAPALARSLNHPGSFLRRRKVVFSNVRSKTYTL